MKYYESHEHAYRKIKEDNISSWDEFRKQSESFENFCMKEYLVTALDKIKPISNARVLGMIWGQVFNLHRIESNRILNALRISNEELYYIVSM